MDPWESDYRKCWRAAAGAYFAAQVMQMIRDGRGAPDKDDYDRMYEEAETVGAEFAERAGKAAERMGG